MAGWGMKVIPESREGSRISPVGPGGVGRPSWRVRRGREAHPDGRGIGSPLNRGGRSWESHTGAGRGREALLEGW